MQEATQPTQELRYTHTTLKTLVHTLITLTFTSHYCNVTLRATEGGPWLLDGGFREYSGTVMIP